MCTCTCISLCIFMPIAINTILIYNWRERREKMRHTTILSYCVPVFLVVNILWYCWHFFSSINSMYFDFFAHELSLYGRRKKMEHLRSYTKGEKVNKCRLSHCRSAYCHKTLIANMNTHTLLCVYIEQRYECVCCNNDNSNWRKCCNASRTYTYEVCHSQWCISLFLSDFNTFQCKERFSPFHSYIVCVSFDMLKTINFQTQKRREGETGNSGKTLAQMVWHCRSMSAIHTRMPQIGIRKCRITSNQPHRANAKTFLPIYRSRYYSAIVKQQKWYLEWC